MTSNFDGTSFSSRRFFGFTVSTEIEKSVGRWSCGRLLPEDYGAFISFLSLYLSWSLVSLSLSLLLDFRLKLTTIQRSPLRAFEA